MSAIEVSLTSFFAERQGTLLWNEENFTVLLDEMVLCTYSKDRKGVAGQRFGASSFFVLK